MNLSKLTEKQKLFLEKLHDYINQNKKSPSLRELQRILDFKHIRSVEQYLKSLEKKGFLKISGKERGIVLLQPQSTTWEIPILGYANCGQPMIFADEQEVGIINIDKSILKSPQNIFCVIARGDSMNQKNIESEDYLIIKKDTEIKNGDIVLAVIDDSCTIKTIKYFENKIALYPQSNNPIHNPIYLSENRSNLILGKVIDILKNPNNV